MIKAEIATPETDKQIRDKEFAKGLQARVDGKTVEDCPWTGGLAERWWLDGFNSIKTNA